MNIQEIWQSEESFETAYNELLKLSKFDRTKDASKLVNRLLAKLVNPHPTFFDIKQWVAGNVKDFNLRSQLLLNAQSGSIAFKIAELEKAVNSWQKDGAFEWALGGDSPFEKKAKFREGGDEVTKTYNSVLANQRNLKIVRDPIGMNSFRISPIGSTPALADLNNLSSISITGLPKFTDARIWILNHEAIQKHINLRQQDDGGFVADGLDYPVYSKSGGDTVTKSLTSRWLADQALTTTQAKTYVVPKYDSLLTGGDPLPKDLQEFAVEFKG